MLIFSNFSWGSAPCPLLHNNHNRLWSSFLLQQLSWRSQWRIKNLWWWLQGPGDLPWRPRLPETKQLLPVPRQQWSLCRPSFARLRHRTWSGSRHNIVSRASFYRENDKEGFMGYCLDLSILPSHWILIQRWQYQSSLSPTKISD